MRTECELINCRDLEIVETKIKHVGLHVHDRYCMYMLVTLFIIFIFLMDFTVFKKRTIPFHSILCYLQITLQHTGFTMTILEFNQINNLWYMYLYLHCLIFDL